MNHAEVFDIAAYCHAAGINQAVISPGSRSALITLSFARHSGIACTIIPDERTAAFVAMGMAQQSGRCVALVCTSGSAALNYYPAIAEAFFNQVPLAIFTADRPPEWINQYDGQTIFQEGVYGKHVKASLVLPPDTSSLDNKQSFDETMALGLSLAGQAPAGPVHFNVPIREPFYTKELPQYQHSTIAPIFRASPEPLDLLKKTRLLTSAWENSSRILIIPGQMESNSELSAWLSRISNAEAIVVCQDIISNVQTEHGIRHHDLFLSELNNHCKKQLAPDLLITFGRSIISKQLKVFIRNHKPAHHFHFENTKTIHDPFQSVTTVLQGSPQDVLKVLPVHTNKSSYKRDWQKIDLITKRTIDTTDVGFSEFGAVHYILSRLEKKSHLHLANSMPVRYANYINSIQDIQVWGNRGVSGIDGCTSTAMGHALANPEEMHYLLSGDIALLYDRNAFWQKMLPQNLRIIVLNNGGGGIFRLIEGPSDLKELEDYFEFSHQATMRPLAEEFGVRYLTADSGEALKTAWKTLMDVNESTILEVKVDRIRTVEVFKDLKVKLNSNLAEI